MTNRMNVQPEALQELTGTAPSGLYYLMFCQGDPIGVCLTFTDALNAAKDFFEDPDLTVESYGHGGLSLYLSNDAILEGEPIAVYNNLGV